MFYVEIKGGCGTHPPRPTEGQAFQGNLEGHCQYLCSTSWMCQPLSHPALGNKVPYVTEREPNMKPLSVQLNRKKKKKKPHPQWASLLAADPKLPRIFGFNIYFAGI